MTKAEVLSNIEKDRKATEDFYEEMELGDVPPAEQDYYNILLKIVKKAPSGWFDDCNCKDCKYCKDGKCTYEESDLISRADTIRDINEWCININNPTNVVREDMMCILEEMPSIQAIDGKKLMGYITDWMCDLAPIEGGENYHDREVKYQTLKEVRELIDALMRKKNE